MAFVNLNNSCNLRPFLLAWRSGKTCCAFCCSQNTFSRNGLQQHYRISHKTAEFSDSTVRHGVKALRKFVAHETKENLITLSEQRSKSDGHYKMFKVESCGETIDLWCSREKEAAKLFGLYLDHKYSLPTLENSGKGMKVNVQNDSLECTFQLWKAQDKVYAEAIYYKTKTPTTILPTPTLPSSQISQPAMDAVLSQDNRELCLLQYLYGYDSFRDGQLEAIQAILQGKDTLVLIPTGGGKSVVYTVPAILNQGLTVVIEPLKFIMEEQAEKLRQKQIQAFFYNSSLTDKEMEFVINHLCRQDLPQAILFTSPECIVSEKLLNVLKKWNDANKLNFIAIDEAHCIDLWGQEFRTDYLKLGLFKDFNVPVVALTGTATKRVQNKILNILKLESPHVVKLTSSRSNLFLQIVPKQNKPKKQMADYISEHYKEQRGIIYCARRKDTVDLAHELKSANINAVFVHGAMKDGERKKHERSWADGLAHVICATKSFGMGIDQKDVRFVLHMSFPESIEDYYQEVGRAGRDGQPATCTLFFKHEDRSFHLHNIVKIEDKEYQEHKYSMLNQMVNYCDSNLCRHKLILSYFDENAQECEEQCDSCTNSDTQDLQDCTSMCKLIVQGLLVIEEKQKKITVLLLTQFLFGSSATELNVLALNGSEMFGSAKPHYRQRNGRKQLQRLIYHLIVTGILKEEPAGSADKPSIVLTKGCQDQYHHLLFIETTAEPIQFVFSKVHATCK